MRIEHLCLLLATGGIVYAMLNEYRDRQRRRALRRGAACVFVGLAGLFLLAFFRLG